ncbi:ACP S-malonyltransferase [Tersicoccus sp. MR15.9]|uniref:ACP S-malonyltransferase n=1 Tax=Tersicoccus mangrovi TaxID=3121635 RepID=UPI002FE62908
MLAIVCPGQGSQTPGFLSPWLELDGTEPLLRALSDATGIDLVAHGTVSDAETIKDTAVAQPLIVAAGVVGARALFGENGVPDGVVLAGHSVGEITAAVLAGALTEADGMAFVKERSTAMARAAAAEPTGMAAVVGGVEDEVLAAIDAAGLTPANMNGGGQIVAAGTLAQLDALVAAPPARARVIPLKVAGAFHTAHMQPAVAALEGLAPSLHPTAPTRTLLSNRDGKPVTSGDETLAAMIGQVSRPVRWDACMQTLADAGVTGLLELPPAGTLTGLAKRGLRGVAGFALSTPDDLPAARDFVAAHAATAAPTNEGQA